ncbi:MAG: NAD(P)/FAD-dependent oxidoreductase [Calditrichia bacterium]
MLHHDKYDALVVGGGPAGSTAATLLAMKGHRVALIEREKFPRYHVGESLIPYCYFILEKLGMLEKLNASSFTKKYSVQFASSSGKLSQPFYFHEHNDHPSSKTWQVVRSEFDKMMLENAAENGVTVFEQMRARKIIEQDGVTQGVIATDVDGNEHRFEASLTVDASGRNGFFATRNGWRVADENLQKISIWAYYEGATRDPGIDEGATTVAYLPDNGWCWYIPLPDNKVSVGVVADKEYLYRESRDPETIMNAEIARNKWLSEHLESGKLCSEYWVTGDYSYRSKHCAADGVVLTGDAFSFLDPVFSSGILLALHSGAEAAEAADCALKSGNVSASQFAEYGESVRGSVEAMRKLIYAFYDSEFNFREFFRKYPDSRNDVTDCLIGRLDRDYDQLFERIGEFAEVPQDLPHGKPLIANETVAG